MIKSMTGFGRSNYIQEKREYTVEIKSVNHKYTDVSVKIPRSISYLEEKVKKTVLSYVSRGKIDVYISFSNNNESDKNIIINKELAKIYIKQLEELASENNIINNINIMDIAKLPDIFDIKNEEQEEIIWEELQIALQEALSSFVNMREEEGKQIKADLLKRIQDISEKTEKICILSTGLVEEYIVKLKDRIKELLNTDIVDEARLAQEIVIYADRTSIEEEITRLHSHIAQFIKLLETNGPIGKKIDFLIQEMNRETNTIGSKANKLEITNLVVEIKTQIENIREQIQNIE